MKLVALCRKEVKTRHFAIKYALQILWFIIMTLYMIQGFRVIKTLALTPKPCITALAIITNSGVCSIHYDKSLYSKAGSKGPI